MVQQLARNDWNSRSYYGFATGGRFPVE